MKENISKLEMGLGPKMVQLLLLEEEREYLNFLES